MFYIVKKIVIAIACYVDICAIWAWVVALGADNITAIASVFIAGCALCFTIWQAIETRKHNKLSVKPLLSGLRKISTKDNMKHYQIIIANNGVGPAIIKSFELLFENKGVSFNDVSTYNSFLNKKIKKLKGLTEKYFSHRSEGSVIKVGEEIILWEFKYDKDENIDEIDKLGLSIKYKSIYLDKVFIFDTKDDQDFNDKKP